MKNDVTEGKMFKMAKMIVMYEEPKDKEGFENHYFSVHIPIAEKGLSRKSLKNDFL